MNPKSSTGEKDPAIEEDKFVGYEKRDRRIVAHFKSKKPSFGCGIPSYDYYVNDYLILVRLNALHIAGKPYGETLKAYQGWPNGDAKPNRPKK